MEIIFVIVGLKACYLLLLGFGSLKKCKMQTRYMERTNSMRGKRSLEGGGDEEQEPERKRPALARYINCLSFFSSCSSIST